METEKRQEKLRQRREKNKLVEQYKAEIQELMHTKVSSILIRVSYILEIIVGLMLIIAIIAAFLPMLRNLQVMYESGGSLRSFETILEQLFTIVIGIEFLKMICRYTMDSVVEVLLFTLARHMIIEHEEPLGTLFTVISIAIMFVIRKFLFVKQLDKGGDEAEKEHHEKEHHEKEHHEKEHHERERHVKERHNSKEEKQEE